MSQQDQVPFVDLVDLHAEFRGELCEVFETSLDSGGFVGGPMVDAFEKDFAVFCDTMQCVGVSSGTDALLFALKAAGVGRGDTVVTVPNTFIATAEAISQAGARISFVDIDEATYNLDPARLLHYLEEECDLDADSGRAVDRRTGSVVSAVVPVHLYGQMADMDPILEIAQRFALTVVEDACQAHGAEYFSRSEGRWRKAGSMGAAAAFSFYPGKNLGAFGEGGAVTTNDDRIADQVRMLRNHGQIKKYHHEIEGYNGRLDSIQAGILGVKLRRLPLWNEQRRECARTYDELLAQAEVNVRAPYAPDWSRHVYHLYAIRVEERERLQQQLAESGIGCGIHYPIPLHLTSAYKACGFGPGDFPISEQVADDELSLPIFPGLRRQHQERVVQELASFACVAQ